MQRVPRLLPGKTSFFVCDIQERFRDIISHMPSVIRSAKLLIQASNPLQIPVVVTEQYPKAFGHTVEELQVKESRGEHGNVAILPKTKFSMFSQELIDLGDTFLPKTMIEDHSVVICGIETHVCVQQTTLELLEHGYNVHIVADGVSSCHPSDRKIALDAMRQAGAFITSTESVLFELMKDAKHPAFKHISLILKEERVDTGL